MLDTKKPSISIGNILVIGLQGEGKSTVINLILGKQVAKVAKDDEVLGETTTVTKYTGLIEGTNTEISIYDLPGYGNLKLNDLELLELWKNNFCDIEIKAILYVSSLSRNRVLSSDIFLLEITRLLFEDKGNEIENENLPKLIFVGTNIDKLDNLESEIKENTQKMIEAINSYSKFKIYDSIVLSNKINNSSEILKLNNMLILNKNSGRTRLNLVIDVIKGIFNERMKSLGFECFSGSMKVKKKDTNDSIKNIFIRDVEIGDLIESENGNYEKVITKTIHLNDNFNVLRLITEDNEFVELTVNHYIYIIRDGNKCHILSKNVKIGDKLIYYNEKTIEYNEIKSIQSVQVDCVVNIRNPSRILIVNKFLCSSVIDGDLGDFGHYVLLFASRLNDKLPQYIKEIAIKINSILNNILNKNF